MFPHISVLKNELVDFSLTESARIAVDCTAGGGGHTGLLLKRLAHHKDSLVIAFDRDSTAINHLTKLFPDELSRGRLKLIHDSFANFAQHITLLGHTPDCIIADLGVSSPQIDDGARGFSFQKDGPLDMRMNTSDLVTAATLVNTCSEPELAGIFWDFGEEPHARYYAKILVERRAKKHFTETGDLADFIKQRTKYKTQSKKHPATKIFQALRIVVNNEISELEKLLADGFNLLRPGGRFGIISFHSLEDRKIKQHFKNLACPPEVMPKGLPLTEAELNLTRPKYAKLIKPFPIIPAETEVAANPRARSAKLRVVEKV